MTKQQSAHRTTRRTQEERSTATREALIAAAIECIAEAGYAHTTTSMIAARADVSRGALQYHFPSRDDLIEVSIAAIMADLNFSIDAAELRELPIAARIDCLIENYHRVFSGRTFVAALNIWLGIHSDEVMKRRMHDLLRQAQKRLADTWSAIFPDVELSKDELMRIRRIAMASVRGYAIHELFGAPTGTWENDSRLIKQLMTDLLRPKSATLPEKRARRGA